MTTCSGKLSIRLTGQDGVVGLSECACLIPVPERTINLDTRRAKPTVIGAGGVVLTYFHSPIISFFCLPLCKLLIIVLSL